MGIGPGNIPNLLHNSVSVGWFTMCAHPKPFAEVRETSGLVMQRNVAALFPRCPENKQTNVRTPNGQVTIGQHKE